MNMICLIFGHKEYKFGKWIICMRCKKNLKFIRA